MYVGMYYIDRCSGTITRYSEEKPELKEDRGNQHNLDYAGTSGLGLRVYKHSILRKTYVRM